MKPSKLPIQLFTGLYRSRILLARLLSETSNEALSILFWALTGRPYLVSPK